MLFLLTGEVQIGKTRWLESLVTELADCGCPASACWRRVSGCLQKASMPMPNGFEKLGIDNVLLPSGERIPFARRGDLARADGTFDEESPGGEGGVGLAHRRRCYRPRERPLRRDHRARQRGCARRCQTAFRAECRRCRVEGSLPRSRPPHRGRAGPLGNLAWWRPYLGHGPACPGPNAGLPPCVGRRARLSARRHRGPPCRSVA